MKLETITGDLCAVAQLEEGTLQHWDELSQGQTADPSLGERSYWVADYPQYGKKGSEAMLYLARLDHNLVLRHLFDPEQSSWEQLLSQRTDHFFRPARDEAQSVVEASDTLPIPLRALRLQGSDNTYRFLQIRTADGLVNTSLNPQESNYEKPITEEQQLLERAGYTSAFLNTLRDSRRNIQEARLYVLAPDFVLQAVVEGPVGRAAWRYYFSSDASSNADVRSVDFRVALRGVRRIVVAAGGAAKNDVPQEINEATIDDFLRYSAPFVPGVVWEQFEAGLRKLYKL